MDLLSKLVMIEYVHINPSMQGANFSSYLSRNTNNNYNNIISIEQIRRSTNAALLHFLLES